jgi:hypothetical protein
MEMSLMMRWGSLQMKIQFDDLAGRPDMTGRAACPTGRKSELKDSGLNIWTLDKYWFFP